MTNRQGRRLGALGLLAIATAALTGCSALAQSATTAAQPAQSELAAQAEQVGYSALEYVSATGWISAAACSPELQAAIESKAPAGATLSPVAPSSISGPLGDPQLNEGDIATCAFTLSSSTKRENQEFFLGMPQSYMATYASRLTADGFVAGPLTAKTNVAGEQQLFTRADDKVLLQYIPSTTSVLSVFG
jgi:hypothetical protein